MEDREKRLQETLKEIEKQFGKGSMFLGDRGASLAEDGSIPTGSLSLDQAIGSGYPKGRITEIYGPESAGKTTLALHAIAEAQKMGGRAAFIDAEHALDTKYAASLGIRLKDLLIAQPDSGEQALEIVEALARSGEVDLVVVDSVAALVPKIEIEGEISDQTVGAQARMMSKALRVLAGTIKRANMAVIFINQLRERIGIPFGNPEITSGGRALRFYASIRLEVRKEGLVKDGDANVGLRTRITVTKNKVNPPFGVAHITIYFGTGFDYSVELIEHAATLGIIEKNGSWYSYKANRLGQGVKQVREALAASRELFEEIKAQTVARLGGPPQLP